MISVLFLILMDLFANECLSSLAVLSSNDTSRSFFTDTNQFLFNANPSLNEFIAEIASYLDYLKNDLGVDFENRYKDRYQDREAEIIKVLVMQNKVEKELLQDPNWKEGMRKRSPLTEISIKQIEDVDSIAFEIPVYILHDFAEFLKEIWMIHYDKLKDENTDVKAFLLNRMKLLGSKLFKNDYKNINPGSIIGGLMQILPIDKNKMPSSALDKIAFLRKHLLTDEVDWERFYPDLAGLPKKDGIYTKEDILEILENILNQKDDSKNFGQIYLLFRYLQYFSSNNLVRKNEVINLIDKIKKDPTIFIKVFNQSFLKSFLLELFNDLNIEVKSSEVETFIFKYISPRINNVLSKERKVVIKGNTVSDYKTPEKIILKEVPPYIAITRGLIGGDCSIGYNWIYPNNYTDRVFYIYKDTNSTKKQIPLGYVAGVYMEVKMGLFKKDNRKTFFIHTINGVDVGLNRSTMILDAFIHNAKLLLNVDKIAVSTKIGGYIETPEIKEAFSRARIYGSAKRGWGVRFYDEYVGDRLLKIPGPRMIIEKLAKKYINHGTMYYDMMAAYRSYYTVLTPRNSQKTIEVSRRDLDQMDLNFRKYSNDNEAISKKIEEIINQAN